MPQFRHSEHYYGKRYKSRSYQIALSATISLTRQDDLGNPNIMLAIKLLSFSAVKPLNLFAFSLEPH